MKRDNFHNFLHPYLFSLILYFPILLIYLSIPHKVFEKWYGSPKLMSIDDVGIVLYFVLLIIGFSISAYVGEKIKLPIFRIRKTVPLWYIRLGLLISILAYIIWFLAAFKRAGSVESLISIYLVDPFFVKENYMKTLPGITTLTQVSVMAIPFMVCFYRLEIIDKILVIIIVIFAMIRSFVYSERLALLEIIIPMGYVFLLKKNVTLKMFVKYFLVTLVGIIAFFVINEAFRSFRYKNVESIWMEGIIRLLGYFLTALNNSILYISEYSFEMPTYHTFQMIWKFPLFDHLYYKVWKTIIPNTPVILYREGLNPEFNNINIIGTMVSDWGFLGAFLIINTIGIISGIIYRLSSKSRFFLAIYSLWFVGLLEFMRISYFFDTRLFPAYLFLLGSLFLRMYKHN